jgi:uncharacterized protein
MSRRETVRVKNPDDNDEELRAAQRRAYRSRNPLWWCNLGALYATRTPPDLVRARKWYAKAAAAGDPRGAYELAMMLLEGEGGPPDRGNGRRLLRAAAACGEIDALKVILHGVEQGRWGFRRSEQAARRYAALLEKALRG